MSYKINEQLLQNRPLLIHTRNEGKPRSDDTLNPQGWVIHSTACSNVPAINIRNSFENHPQNQANSHYAVDYQTIIKMIPENEICWACGYTGNHKFLQVELCEFDDSNKFQEAWNRVVWLIAQSCVQYGWNTNDNVNSHRGISLMYPSESNHTDPIGYLQSHGKTWDELLQAIDVKIIELKSPISTIQSTINNNQGDDNVLDIAVLLFSKEDYWSGYDVCVKNGNCALFTRFNGTIPKEAMSAKKLIVVGGGSVNHQNEILLSGNTKYDTAQAVGKYLG